MMNLSKYSGIPASRKVGLEALKLEEINWKRWKGQSGYLALLYKRVKGGYTGWVDIYPVYHFVEYPHKRHNIVKVVKV